jgi:hypothetical protein
MEMTRREFFKIVGATLAVSVIPRVALSESPKIWDKLIGGSEFGAAVHLMGPYKNYSKWTSEFLVSHARKTLGKGVTIELRVGMPTDYGRSHQAAWYTNARIGRSKPTGHTPLTINKFGGFWSAGFFRT